MQAPRRHPRRGWPTARERLGVHTADAFAGARRANRDSLVIEDNDETTIDLAGHNAASSLDDLDLAELNSDAAQPARRFLPPEAIIGRERPGMARRRPMLFFPNWSIQHVR
jgi:hypothetical protein